jgi:GDPmannose 4,6-dehydratase
VADASKARRELGWEPTIGFDAMIAEMVEAQLEALRRS